MSTDTGARRCGFPPEPVPGCPRRCPRLRSWGRCRTDLGRLNAKAPCPGPFAEPAPNGNSRFFGDDLTQGGDADAMTLSLTPGSGVNLFRALIDGGPQTAHELAERTGLPQRTVREWLGGQAVRGYVTYDSTAEIFLLTPEQAA